MPAFAEEIDAALEEGIEIVELVAPVAVLSKNGKLTGVRLHQERARRPGRERPRRGRCRSRAASSSCALDTLVVAISEQPEAESFAGLRTTKWNTIETNPESTAAGKPGVFGGGDVARGPTRSSRPSPTASARR